MQISAAIKKTEIALDFPIISWSPAIANSEIEPIQLFAWNQWNASLADPGARGGVSRGAAILPGGPRHLTFRGVKAVPTNRIVSPAQMPAGRKNRPAVSVALANANSSA